MAEKKKEPSREKLEKLKTKIRNLKPTTTAKRFKALVSFIEIADVAECRSLMAEKPDVPVSLLLEIFQGYALNCQKGRHNQTEVQHMITVLRSTLQLVGPYFKRAPQHTEAIFGIIERMLWKENKHIIRIGGYECLLLLLDNLEAPSDQQILYAVSSFNVIPFTIDYVGITLRHSIASAPDKNSALLPSSSIATKPESIECLSLFLDFITKRPANFDFWFRVLKTYFLPLFYPAKCREITLLDPTDQTGFHPTAPVAFQIALIDRIEQWNQVEAMVNVAWGSPQNIALMMEIYRHALATLSIGGSDEIMKRPHNDVIRKLVKSHQNLFMVSPLLKVIQANSLQYRRFFIDNFKQTFMTPIGSGEKLGAHLKLASDIVDTMRSLVEAYDVFESDIKDALLLTLLDITNSVLITPAQKPLADKLASSLCEAVLWAWIRTRVQSEKLWSTLQTTMFSMFHMPEVVTQLRLKCHQLTNVVVRLLYPEGKEAARKRIQQMKDDLKTSVQDMAGPGGSVIAPPQTVSLDPIERLNWDIESIKYAWLKMLHVMRNVNKLTDPAVHATVLSVLTEVINTLLRAEVNLPTEELSSPLKPKRINLLNVFGAWLFEACTLPDMPFIKGKADAAGALCRLVTMRHVNPLPVQLLRHFYAVVTQALSEPTLSTPFVSWAVIEHSAPIFSTAMPGAGVLIPLYLAEFKRLLRPDTSNPPNVRRKAIQIMGSLVCYANHMRDVDIPSLTNNPVPEFRYQDLTRLVVQILTDVYNNEQVAEHRVMCIHTFSVIIQDELMNVHRSGNKALIGEVVKLVLTACTYAEEAVFTAALECVSSLAVVYKQLEAADETLVGFIVEYLATNLVRQIPEIYTWKVAATEAAGPASRTSSMTPLAKYKAFEALSTMVTLQMYSVLEWLLAAPSRLLDGPNTASQRVFEALGIALVPPNEILASMDIAVAGVAPPVTKDEDKRRMKEKKKEKKEEDKKDTKSKQLPPVPGGVLAADFRTPEDVKEDAIEEVQDAAKFVLAQLSNFFNKFPSRDGPEVCGALVDESMDLPEEGLATHYYAYDDRTILALVHVPNPTGEGALARVVVRDFCGRYAWDADLSTPEPPPREPAGLSLAKLHSYLNDPAVSPAFDRRSTMLSPTLLAASGSQLPERKSTSFSFPLPLPGNAPTSVAPTTIHEHVMAMAADDRPRMSRVPSFRLSQQLANTAAQAPTQDQLEQLLKYLGESHPDVLWGERKLREVLNEPCAPLEENLLLTQTTERSLLDQITEDLNLIDIKKPVLLPAGGHVTWPNTVHPAEKPAALSPYQQCRLLLSHLHYLPFDQRRHFAMMRVDEKFHRSLHSLDKILPREMVKVGLIYVQKGQDDQRIILKNDSKSPLYQDFVNGLAWKIDVGLHRGYLGGLDRRLTNGSVSPYWATQLQEVIFHDITTMPTAEGDEQQILKKRHVGNDMVHIVWSEHSKDYRPLTITSQFNDAHVIIYPLPNGLFRIQIFRKDDRTLFGPLCDGMVVTKLVRQTALNANRYVRHNSAAYTRPYVTRQKAISEIIQKHKQSSKEYQEVLRDIVQFRKVKRVLAISSPPTSPRRDGRDGSPEKNSAAGAEQMDTHTPPK